MREFLNFVRKFDYIGGVGYPALLFCGFYNICVDLENTHSLTYRFFDFLAQISCKDTAAIICTLSALIVPFIVLFFIYIVLFFAIKVSR